MSTARSGGEPYPEDFFASTQEIINGYPNVALGSAADAVVRLCTSEISDPTYRLALRMYRLAVAAVVEVDMDSLDEGVSVQLNRVLEQGLEESARLHREPLRVPVIEDSDKDWQSYFNMVQDRAHPLLGVELPEGTPDGEPLVLLAYLEEGRYYFIDLPIDVQPAAYRAE